jgi:hypothetical protein
MSSTKARNALKLPYKATTSSVANKQTTSAGWFGITVHRLLVFCQGVNKLEISIPA